MIDHLLAEKAFFLPFLGRTPRFKVVILRVTQVKVALAFGKFGEVEVNSHASILLLRRVTEQYELARGVLGHGEDGPDTDGFAKGIVLPSQPLIKGVSDMVRGNLVVDEDKNGALVPKLPQMGILVDFLPSEATISSQEGVTVTVGGKGSPDVADGHHESDS